MSTKIDRATLRAACSVVAKQLKRLPAADERASSKQLLEFLENVETLEDLVNCAEPGEWGHAFALLLLARETLPNPRAGEKTKRFEHTKVHHGDLVVDGKLAVTTDLWVTGNLRVGGTVSIGKADDASLYVAGNVDTTALSWNGPRGAVVIGGALRAREMVTIMESVLIVCGAIQTRFVGVSAIGGDVISPKRERSVLHWIGTDEAMLDGNATRARMKKIFRADLFRSQDDDSETDAVVSRAWKRLASKKAIWR
jgi:hypothetical protein